MNTQHTSPALTTAIAFLAAREHGQHVIWHDHAVGHLVYASREDGAFAVAAWGRDSLGIRS